MIVFAYPKFRARHHNAFEMIHRFCGWTAVALLWAQVRVYYPMLGLEISPRTRLGRFARERLQEPGRIPRPCRRPVASVLADVDLDDLDHLAMGAPPEGPCPLGGPLRSLCPALLRLW